MKRRQVCLIRHGMTEANEKWLYCGRTDLPLSARGSAELEALRDLGGYPNLQGVTVYTSGMLGAEQTLELLYGAIPHGTVPDLREMDFGQFEMRSYDQMKEDPAFQAWIGSQDEEMVCPGGECVGLVKRRVTAAFRRLLAETEGDLLLVIHGGPMAILMGDLFPEEGKGRWDWQAPNGKGYELSFGEVVIGYRALPR